MSAFGGKAEKRARMSADAPKRTLADCRLKGMSALFEPVILSELGRTKALGAARQ